VYLGKSDLSLGRGTTFAHVDKDPGNYGIEEVMVVGRLSEGMFASRRA
jgi:hypothetical protein